MNKDINFTLQALVPILRMNGEKVVSIEAVNDWFEDGEREYCKEVAEITYENGAKRYADIGCDSNLTAIYDVLAVIQQIKPRSAVIERIERDVYAKPKDKSDDDFLIEAFGMTADAIERVMRNHCRVTENEVKTIIEHADYYINPQDYTDGLPDGWDEKDEDDDGYPNLYQYAKDVFEDDGDGERVFKELISFGTTHGGMGSAYHAMDIVRANRMGRSLKQL